MAAILFDCGETPAHDTIPVEQEFADKLAVAGGDHAVSFGGSRSISLSLAKGACSGFLSGRPGSA
jgi:hypothetical protein